MARLAILNFELGGSDNPQRLATGKIGYGEQQFWEV